MENLKNVAPIEDFNWDAYENGESFAGASHEELEKAYDGTLNKVNDREVVDGTVIAMNKREVVVNIGYKSDGIIPLNEFRYNPDLKVGDTVEVYIENQEDKKGWFCLTEKPALPVLGIALMLLWKMKKLSRVTSSAALRVV